MKEIKHPKITMLIVVTIFAITLYVLANIFIQRYNRSYFERFHFNYWELEYPSESASIEFREEIGFGSDRLDYIIVPLDEEIETLVNHYLIEKGPLIFRHGEKDMQYSVKDYLFSIINDDGQLEARINSYDEFDYWILQSDELRTFQIIISEVEVVLIFLLI
jgi:hypothetical protein